MIHTESSKHATSTLVISWISLVTNKWTAANQYVSLLKTQIGETTQFIMHITQKSSHKANTGGPEDHCMLLSGVCKQDVQLLRGGLILRRSQRGWKYFSVLTNVVCPPSVIWNIAVSETTLSVKVKIKMSRLLKRIWKWVPFSLIIMYQVWKMTQPLLVAYNYSKHCMSNISDIIESSCHKQWKRIPHSFGVALLSECLPLCAGWQNC